MADEFDEELDRGPEGHIITPILLGCGAMGLGCLFSLGAIAIGIMIFLPGIWGAIGELGGNPMLDEALPMVEANPSVLQALGTPIEAELDDVDEAHGTDGVSIQVGEDIEIAVTYVLTGPNGTASLEAVGSREVITDDKWTILSLIVTLDNGEQIRIYPGETDAPPPPTQLAPPESSSEEQVDDGVMPDEPTDTGAEPADEPEEPAPSGE